MSTSGGPYPGEEGSLPARDFLSEIAAVPDTGQLATGHLSVTGTATIATGLANTILSCGASLANPTYGAGNGYVVGVTPAATPGQITITVKDSAGNQATVAAVVDWWASEAE